MADLGPLEDLSGSDLLAEVAVLHRAREEAGVRILRGAAEFAFANGPERFDPRLRIDGDERLVRVGGEGTPEVAEFGPAELAVRLQRSPYAGRLLIADALDLQFRLPRLWERVERLEVRESYARMVARKTRALTREQAGCVDRRVHAYADVDAAIRAADRAAARAREEEAGRRQFAKPTRESADGMHGFYVRAGIAVITRLEATVARLAAVLGDLGHQGNEDERRVLAVLLMAHPAEAVQVLARHARGRRDDADALDTSKLLPTVWLFVHLAVDPRSGRTGDVARVESHGPLTPDWIRSQLGDRARFKITPVLDPLGQAPVDAYEIPDRHR
ncbi:hypothetical protein [Nocardioides terrisoli]|uniref:hypothetical protein n=1 Tax=Nocardioides terrisoli TaxID=3388267 RepID=UPI00287B7957|nr:hypothetical protein [Nocardioides marmorisolisilvae]